MCGLSHDATTGHSSLALLRDDEVRAPQRGISEGLDREYHRSRRRAGPSRAWTTNALCYRDYAQAATRGISTRPIMGQGPEPRPPPLDPPGAATLPGERA